MADSRPIAPCAAPPNAQSSGSDPRPSRRMLAGWLITAAVSIAAISLLLMPGCEIHVEHRFKREPESQPIKPPTNDYQQAHAAPLIERTAP